MNTRKELTSALLSQSENNVFHSAYENELQFYSAVKKGDLEHIKEHIRPFSSEGFGVLSDNQVKNFRYHFIICVALITRFCMEGGMPSETAYTLSDLYIRHVDKLNDTEEITKLHYEMTCDFTKRMRDINQARSTSKIVSLAIDYIHKNIHIPIREAEIAEYVHVNPSYLSSLFKKEMGMSFSTYIHKEKVKVAENMLKFSDLSYSDIANYLSFSSHSHFISIFKKYSGTTPKDYREKNYKSNWNVHE